MEPTIEKASDTAIAIVTKEVIEVADLQAQRDELQRQIAQITQMMQDQIDPIQASLDETNAKIAKAAELGVITG